MTTAPATALDATPGVRIADHGDRAAAIAAVAGPVIMFAGAAVWASTGTDLDAAVTDGTVATYLADVATSPGGVYAHLFLWIVGAPLLGLAGVLLVDRFALTGARGATARVSSLLGGALAVTAFAVWFALLELRGGGASPELVHVLGFLASRVDWIATVLLIGFPPLLLSLAPDRPRWQRMLGMLAGAAGVLALVGVATGSLGVTFPVVPLGLAWFLATAIHALRAR